MKMMYVGTLATEPDRDSSWIKAIVEQGHEVTPFSTLRYHALRGNVMNKLRRRFNIGSSYRQLQRDLMAQAGQVNPQWIHFRLPVEFDRRTIEALKNRDIVVTQYFNDNPFSPDAPAFYHSKFRHALSAYDGHFVFRSRNIDEYLAAGARHVEHCPPHYDPSLHIESPSFAASRSFTSDAAFVGHWEDDWRVECLDALVENGFRVELKGGMWDQAIKGRRLGSLAPIGHAFRNDFSSVYAGALAGLCFFSKLNRDTWTRRPLEIIASGGVLVCERTDEAQCFFKDREEAFFFSTIDELVEIVRLLRKERELRTRVQKAGYTRLLKGKHRILDRVIQIERFVFDRLEAKAQNKTS